MPDSLVPMRTAIAVSTTLFMTIVVNDRVLSLHLRNALTLLAFPLTRVLGDRTLPFYHASRLLNWLAVRPCLAPKHLRNAFNQTPDAPFVRSKNHTHADAAAMRKQGSATCRAITRSIGMLAFFFQTSTRDEKKDAGARSWFWTKDLTTVPRPYDPGPDHLVIMVDTDHYVDMPAALCREFRPYLLRTFQPHEVAATRKDYSYCFNKRNEVIFPVAGGGFYSHPVWNWQQDHLVATHWQYGIYPITCHYLVDRRYNGEDHELVLLTPVARYAGFSSFLSRIFLSGKPLERMTPNQGEFNILNVRRADTHTVSMAQPDLFTCANVPRSVYDAALATARTLKNEITPPIVEGILASVCDRDKPTIKLTAAVITAQIRKTVGDIPPFIFPVEDAVRRYQYGNYVPEAKASLTPFMSPFVHGAFAPDQTLGNEQRAVKSRITDFQQPDGPATTKEVAEEVNQFTLNTIDEFVAFVSPRAHELVPVGLDELMENQSTPSQRSILNNATGMVFAMCNKVLSFVKKEAYASPNDPRVISTLQPLIKHDYSMYIYAAAKTIASHPWYAFAKPPIELSARVVEVVSDAQTAAVTDFSRYDGRMDYIARLVEKCFLLRTFARQYHNDILELHEHTYKLQGIGRFGTRYETNYARNSGVTDTAAFNTLINAFVNYLAIRMERRGDGTFSSPEEAWTRLCRTGLFGGDDGLVADPAPTLPKAAAMLHHKLTIDIIPRGQLGITFLARVFGPDVWYGDNASMCDLPRQLAKFHTSPNLPANVTPLMKIAEKARSFHLTDANTPIIGPFVTRVCELTLSRPDDSALDGIRRWGDDVERDLQWPNPPRDWYFEVARQGLPGLSYSRFVRYVREMDARNMLSPPLLMEVPRHPTKARGVVDEETFYDEEPIKVNDLGPEGPNAPEPAKRKNNRGRRTGKPVSGA